MLRFVELGIFRFQTSIGYLVNFTLLDLINKSKKTRYEK